MSLARSREHIDPARPVEMAFAELARPLVQKVLTYAEQVGGDPENLHQLRVTLRTMRSLWWAYQPLLDKQKNTRQRMLFKSLADAAGKTRDYDILLELLSSRPQSEGALPSQFASARQHALDASRKMLGQANLMQVLHDALDGTSRELAMTASRLSLRHFAESRVKQSEEILKKRVRRAKEARRSRYAALHDVRKASKKVRYLLDLFTPVLSRRHSKSIRRVKKIQKYLGKLNDLVASEALLREDIELLESLNKPEETLGWFKKQSKSRMRTAKALLRHV